MFCENCGREILEDSVCDCVKQPKEINSYLIPAITVSIFCCVPFGIVAIIYSMRVSNLVAAGKIEEAERSARTAKMWCWMSFILGIIATLAWFALEISDLKC